MGRITTMLIITGPEESGLRELALFCRRLGLETGGDAEGTPQAGDNAVVRINEDISRKLPGCEESEGKAGSPFGKLGSLWPAAFRKNAMDRNRDSIQREYEEAIRSLSEVVIVDPRFMRCPALLEIWHAIRNDLRVLLTYRAPASSPADNLRESFSDCIEMLLKLDIGFQILLYPQFLTQSEIVCATISEQK